MGREPGIYLGLSNEEYHDDPAVGSSGIKMLIERPRRFWYASAKNPDRPAKKSTKPMKFGTAYHTLILEPEKFDYKIKFGVDESGIAGTLGEGEYNRLIAMKNQIFSKPRRAALLSEGISEVSFFWRDEQTGIMCKVRWDKFAAAWILDLKTALSITDKALYWAIRDLGYDVSGAMYSIAARELKKMIRNGYQMPPEFSQEFVDTFVGFDNQLFAFMIQEKEPPYFTRCPVLTPGVAAVGRNKFRAGLDAYAKCEREGWEKDDYEEIEDMDMDRYSNTASQYD